MPTVEERLAALEKQMAAWMDQRPTTYYPHQYSGEEIDNAVSRALPNGAIDQAVGTFVRPNLLDNWYFGNPVDQRGGHIVLQGKMAYRDAECTIEAGGVSETAMTVTKVSDTVYTFKGGDNNPYYVKAADVVRGYTGNGYTVDRWLIGSGSNGTLSLTESGLKIIRTDGPMYLCHRISKTQIPEGSTLTYSVLTTSGLFSISFVVKNDTYHEQSVGGGISLGWNYTPAEIVELTLVNNTVNSSVTIKAAKLELGPTQTLAHQDAAGNWVLNEVPKGGNELRECQRYAIDLAAAGDRLYGPVGIGVAVFADRVYVQIPLPTTMRTAPVVKFTGTWRLVHGTQASSGTLVAGMEIDHISSNGVSLNVWTNGNLLTIGETYQLWRTNDDPNNSLLLSADL